MEYTIYIHSVIKKNEILLFAGKWMKLENIILNEISQVKKAKGHGYVEYRPTTNTSNIMKNRS
jgi:hypothetical protein